MKTHARKKVEIIVERPLLAELLDLLDEEGAAGYTVVPAIAGKGLAGRWRADDISGALDRVMVVVITNEAVAEALVARAFDLLKDYTAIVYVSDVAVVRGDRF